MNTVLPKDLTIFIRFQKSSFRFYHRLFDNSLLGHFGLISQFIISELYAERKLQNIIQAFPFNVMPIVERLQNFSIVWQDSLTELGKHYGFCLAEIHGKEIQAWSHWGRDLKILLPYETNIVEKDSFESNAKFRVDPYNNRQRPFTFSRQKEIKEVLEHLFPEYGEIEDSEYRESDVWRLDSTIEPHADDADINICTIFLPQGTELSQEGRFTPLLLPSLAIRRTYKKTPGLKSFLPPTEPAPQSDTEICLLTGERLKKSDSFSEDIFFQEKWLEKSKWPESDMISQIPEDVLGEDREYRLYDRKVSLEKRWRKQKLPYALISESISKKNPLDKIWISSEK